MRKIALEMVVVLVSLFAVGLATTGWAAAFVLWKMKSYSTEWLRVEEHRQELVRDTLVQYVFPFVPACVIAALILGVCVVWKRPAVMMSGLLYGAGALIAYTGTAIVIIGTSVDSFAGPSQSGYAAEQSSAILVLLVGPVLGVTASPLWFVGGLLVGLCASGLARTADGGPIVRN